MNPKNNNGVYFSQVKHIKVGLAACFSATCQRVSSEPAGNISISSVFPGACSLHARRMASAKCIL